MSGGRTCVVVTGGGSGIGLATARLYASKGANVAILGRTQSRLSAAVEDLRATALTPAQRFTSRVVDLSSFAAAKQAIDSLVAEGFAPDILVNSAGVIVPGEFANMPLEHFESNLDNGYWSVVYPCRAAIPHMTAKGRGHIVNVSSVAGYLGIYGYTGYSSAKYAVMGFSEALRFELRPAGVKVHVVCPPDTDTPALAKEREMRPAITDALAGNIRPISAERVAKAIASGVDRGKYYIIPDATSAVYFRLKGLMPELFFGIVDGDVARARKR